MAVRIESKAEPIPGYTLVERLGGGGFGEVWKAVAPGGLYKAIKFVYGDLDTAGDDGQRAEQELKALSRVKSVRHPYILSLERYDIIDGQLLIVMELADRNLWDRFRECREQGLPGIPRDELLGYMDETAEALDLMNEQYQLQHLDIKPQNLFLVHNHAKVADFGLVKDLEGMMAAITGGVTPVYAAPETFDGWVSRFCDQYSLAIVYQELLTGQRPFSGTNVRQLILQHLQGVPNLEPLPACDREALGRALAKKPEERHPTCQAMVHALRSGRALDADAPQRTLEGAAETWHTPASTPTGPVVQAPRETRQTDADLARHPGPAAPAQAGSTQWIRLREAVPARVEPSAKLPAFLGQGILFPALVVGLGEMGLRALQQLRQTLEDQVGRADALPTLRFLYLDTDPEAPRRAAEGTLGAPLAQHQILHVKLCRPSHYIRPHHGRGPIDTWFNPKMLYRIPRSLLTNGVRALGRLAFLDNYRSIVRRLCSELNACTKREALEAAQKLPLGLRASRPRVYIVSSLAGGTGGGMFLDLAYVLRSLLKDMGHDRPDIAGIFFLPPVGQQPGRAQVLGNAFAALTELNHFSNPETCFIAHYDEREKPVIDPEPPFGRCVLLPLQRKYEEQHVREAADLAAELLYRDLATTLGRAADTARERTAISGDTRGLLCQAVGMYRLSWPRSALVRGAARRLCVRLVERWLTKDAAGVRSALETQIAEFWERDNLIGEHQLTRLQQAAALALGQPPETAFAALVERMQQASLPSFLDYYAFFRQTMQQTEDLVGRTEEILGTQPAVLAEPLKQAATALVQDCGRRLARFVLQLIEQPGYRLAGAEEAARQLITVLEKELQHHESLGKELHARATEAHGRIFSLLEMLRQGQPASKKTAALIPTLIELIGIYPKWRYQAYQLQLLTHSLVSLRGNLSDELREVNFCRSRLGDLLRTFQNPAHEPPSSAELPFGRYLLPAGNRSIGESVGRLVAEVTAGELQNLDARVQGLLRQRFTALVHVCLAPANLMPRLTTAMQQDVEAYVFGRLANVNVVEMYLAACSGEGQAEDDLAEAFDEAAPELGRQRDTRQTEISIVAAPPGPGGERLLQIARQALSDVDLQTAAAQDDIVLYREWPHVALGQLEQLGPQAREAYCQMSALENFTPHSRMDIQEWRAVPAVQIASC